MISKFRYYIHSASMILLISLMIGCQNSGRQQTTVSNSDDSVFEASIRPAIVTEQVANDSDDPAIWINKKNPAESLILGTDKGNEAGIGAIYVFDLQGNIIPEKTLNDIQRPNNIDVEYGMVMGKDTIDIAVFTERYAEAIRVVRLPDMEMIDAGGIKVFEGEEGLEFTKPMGIAMYKNPENGKISAIVGRKNGPPEEYLWQYDLQAEAGMVSGKLVRKFGQFSGKNEVEAIAIDDEAGYVYYSDEGVGVRKYYADPDSSNQQLALFATDGFREDHEGISIYKKGDFEGYILISDQQDNSFRVYSRSGTPSDPHHHRFLAEIYLSTIESDGSEVTSYALRPDFPGGLFVAMSDDGTFQYYPWEKLEELIETFQNHNY